METEYLNCLLNNTIEKFMSGSIPLKFIPATSS